MDSTTEKEDNRFVLVHCAKGDLSSDLHFVNYIIIKCTCVIIAVSNFFLCFVFRENNAFAVPKAEVKTG